ncbi:MAG: response regulator [Clostridia bacterium]|nr:response regulator [Clostridia bacterium]
MKKNLMSRRRKGGEASSDEELFRIFTSCIDDVFIMLSCDNLAVEFVTENAERVLGVPVREIRRNISILGGAKYTDDKVVDMGTLEKIPVGGCISLVAGREHRRSKERRFFKENVYRVAADNSEKFVVVFSDCTKELQARQSLEEALSIAKAANKSKSTFLASMSHDIRTPMNTIVGLCTLLNRDMGDKVKLADHVKHIELTSRHMLTLINDILDMSKIESGETTLNIAEIKISDLVKEIDEVIAPQAKAKGLSYVAKVNAKADEFLGDKLRIKRVMTNILNNAVKYTPDGGKVEFTVQQMARPSLKYLYLQFTIKDNGIGMSEGFLKKIFEPFTRELAATDVQGTGLGMPIAKNLVDLMGGTIAVESEVGAGTTFTLTFKFPLSKVDDTQFWLEHGISRVLFVGGNDIDGKSITWAMRKAEVAVSVAKNAKSAQSSIEKALMEGKGYNAVLCEWRSEKTSLQTIKDVKKELPEYVPLIVFGDCERGETQVKAMDAGANGFLSKPFLMTAFKDCIMGIKAHGETEDDEQLSALSGKKLLAAEDNELNSMVLCELLNMVGATCVVKPDGKQALEEFENSSEGEYDGILMDVQMPVMDGYEATKAIRMSGHAQAKSIPIIAMTANAFAEDVNNSYEAGMDAYLLKPIEMAKLEELFDGFEKSDK